MGRERRCRLTLREQDPVVVITKGDEDESVSLAGSRQVIGIARGMMPRIGDKVAFKSKLWAVTDIVWHTTAMMNYEPIATVALGLVMGEEKEEGPDGAA